MFEHGRLRLLIAGALMTALGVGAIWMWQGMSEPAPNASLPAKARVARRSDLSGTALENGRPAVRSKDGKVSVAAVAKLAEKLNDPNFPPQNDLSILEDMLSYYRRSNGGFNPGGGLNEEIVDKMRGLNSKQFAVIPPDIRCVNPAGQLLDRWGTPYFFHPVSGTVLEIRSAGPDRKMWTKDDIVSGVGGDGSYPPGVEMAKLK